MSDRIAPSHPKPQRLVPRIPWTLGVAAFLTWVIFYCPLPFAAWWWNVDAERGNLLGTRYRVAERLVTSGRLSGMTRLEVIALLGEPSGTEKFKDHGVVYVLGPEYGFVSVDHHWLLVDFDLAGKVSNVVVVSD